MKPFLPALCLLLARCALAQTIEVPAGQVAVLTAEGRGVQIYRCTADKGWMLVAPDAELFVDGAKVGVHGAGPVWRYKDGSSVTGSVSATQASEGAVPWLLLRATSHQGEGKLSPVTYVVRSSTTGGLADAIGCNATTVGTVSRVSYTATYTFYKPAP